MADFKAAMGQIYPDATVTAELFPASGAGQYGTEISALMQGDADVVQSSLWGGDLQALPRGLYQKTKSSTRRETTCCRRWATTCPRA